MCDRFLIRIEAWPYSLGKGRAVDQSHAGAREQTFIVRASDIADALEKATLFQRGMLTSPWVHQAPITEIRQARHDEDARSTSPDPTSVQGYPR